MSNPPLTPPIVVDTVIEKIIAHVQTTLEGMANVGVVLDALAEDETAIETQLAAGKDAIEWELGDDTTWTKGEADGLEAKRVALAICVHLGTKPQSGTGKAETWTMLARRRGAEIECLFAGEDAGSLGGNAVMTNRVTQTGVGHRAGRRAFAMEFEVFYRHAVGDPTQSVPAGGGD